MTEVRIPPPSRPDLREVARKIIGNERNSDATTTQFARAFLVLDPLLKACEAYPARGWEVAMKTARDNAKRILGGEE